VNRINVDHRGKLVESVLDQLPFDLSPYGDSNISMTTVNRTTLEFGDVEWESGRPWYIELKRSRDLIRSLVSGHMQAQEQDLLDLPGEKAVVVTGRIRASEDGNSQYSDSFSDGFDPWEYHSYRYTAIVNYLSHLQERGITVVRCDYERDVGRVLAGIYARSWKTTKTEDRVIRVKQVSLTPEANAVKSMFPHLRLRGEQCDTIARVAGVQIGKNWIDECRNENGKVIIKQLQDKLPGVGRPTIKAIFGV